MRRGVGKQLVTKREKCGSASVFLSFVFLLLPLLFACRTSLAELGGRGVRSFSALPQQNSRDKVRSGTTFAFYICPLQQKERGGRGRKCTRVLPPPIPVALSFMLSCGGAIVGNLRRGDTFSTLFLVEEKCLSPPFLTFSFAADSPEGAPPFLLSSLSFLPTPTPTYSQLPPLLDMGLLPNKASLGGGGEGPLILSLPRSNFCSA